MSSGSKSVRQHWVPNFYLSYFSTVKGSGRLYVTDVKTAYKSASPLKKNTKTPKDIANIRHLYSEPEELVGDDHAKLEMRFQSLETEAGRLWASISDGKITSLPPGSEPRNLMSRYLAAQHLRTPRMIAVARYAESMEDGMSVETSEDADRFYAALERIQPPLGETREDAAGRASFREAQTEQLAPVADVLNEMHWSVMVFQKRVLLTSDNPVYVIDRETGDAWMMGDPKCLVFFPITPNHLLLISGTPLDSEDGGFSQGSEDFVREKVNPLTVHFSTEQAYSPFRLDDGFPFLR